MLTLMVFGIIVGLIVLTIVCRWQMISLGVKWMRAKPYPRRKMVLAVAMPLFLGIAVAIFVKVFDSGDESTDSSLVLMFSLMVMSTVVFPWWCYARLFRLRKWKAGAVWLLTLLADVVFLIGSVFLVRPYVFEAYHVPSNSMAPTILGGRWTGSCPLCDSPSYGSVPPPIPSQYGEPVRESYRDPTEPTICENYHVVHSGDHLIQKWISGDRVLAMKFLAPHRWDVIVFRFPLNPDQNFVKRLVGLPGETVVIKEGFVWINGTKMEPPSEIAGLRFTSTDESGHSLFGTEESPAELDEGEYFVVGDFSVRAYDSRFWYQQSDVREEYVVQESHLIGVATHRYWPPARWGSLIPSR